MSRGIVQIRRVNWLLVMVCFFLPFGRGCAFPFPSELVPSEAAFTSWPYFAFFGLPFLYPLLLAIGWGMFRILRSDRVKMRTATALCCLCFGLLTWLVREMVVSLYIHTGSPLVTDSLFAAVTVLLWGLMAFTVRRLSVGAILQMLSFQVSLWSLVWLVFLFTFYVTRLVGAWLSLAANVVVTVTFVLEHYVSPARSPDG